MDNKHNTLDLFNDEIPSNIDTEFKIDGENLTFDESELNIHQAVSQEIKMRVDEPVNIINKVEYGRVNIMVMGVGGCGCNAVNRMFKEKIDEIKLIAIDTSSQTLDNIEADYKMLIGEEEFMGHGSGGNTIKCEKIFVDAKDKFKQLLNGVDMLFLAGGIGRGTGSVGLVEIGKLARDLGVLTIGFATLPRTMESNSENVKKFYPQFIEAVDSNVIVENERVSKIAHGLPLMEAMRLADSMLVEGIKGIFELITKPGKINLDYADIRTAFSDQGSCVMGIGKGKGDDAVLKAIQNSIHSDIANIESVKNAKTIIFNITCTPKSITIDEASRGSDLIYSFGHRDNIEHLLFGYSYDETLGDEIKVTFIATGTTPTDFSYDQFDEVKPMSFKPKTEVNIFDKADSIKQSKSTTSKVKEENTINIPDFF